VGTIYKFFPNKEKLYEAIILENYDHWHFSLMGAVNSTRDELESIKNYIEMHIRLFKENLEFVRLYLRLYYTEARGGSFNIQPGLRADIKKKNDQILKKLAKLFEKGMRKNIFKRLEPYHLAMTLEAITHAFSRHYFETRDEESFKADIIMKVFLESILKDQPSKA
jgi:AcrR family transcriptional regulator